MRRLCPLAIAVLTAACGDDHVSNSARELAAPVAAMPPPASESSASSAQLPDEPPSLAGTAWLAEDIDGHGVVDTAQSTLEFLEEGKAAGRAGCNRFGGSVSIAGRALQLTKLMSTKMACEPALMDQEERFLKALGFVRTYRFERGKLLLLDQGGQARLRFSRHEEPQPPPQS